MAIRRIECATARLVIDTADWPADLVADRQALGQTAGMPTHINALVDKVTQTKRPC